MKTIFSNLYKSHQGATMVEYAVILGLIVLVALAAANLLDVNITNLFTAVANVTNSSGNPINGSVTVS